jgi:hypothetical protein
MTIHDRAFWHYLGYLSAIGFGIICGILLEWFHPSISWGNSFIALNTDTTIFSLQWTQDQVSFWINANGYDWQIFPVR